jgi:hypothetical protein
MEFSEAQMSEAFQAAKIDKRWTNLLIQQFRFCIGENIPAAQMFNLIGWWNKLPPAERDKNSQKLERYRMQLLAITQKFKFDTIFKI